MHSIKTLYQTDHFNSQYSSIMKLQAIAVVSLFLSSCHGFTITGSKDADYVAVEMGGSDNDNIACLFQVLIKGCTKGATLESYFGDNIKKLTVSGKQIKACLLAKCTYSGSKLTLSSDVDIGGQFVSSKPDVLKEGTSANIFKSQAKCMSGAASATVTCNYKTKGDQELELEEFDDETMFAQDNDDTNENLPLDNNEDTQSNAALLMQDNDDDDDDDDTGNNDIPDDSQQSMMMGEDDSNTVDLANQLDSSKAQLQEQGAVGEGTTAKLQWNNWFRSTLYIYCGNRRGLYWVRSGHSNHYEDRIWHFECKTVTDINFNHCYWTGYQNGYDLPLMTQCGADYMMSGIYSNRYSNHHRDRQFSILCCRAPSHYARHCYLSGYVNGWDGWMNYAVGGRRVFNGAFSWHHNGREDRIWKFSNCWYSR